MLHTDRGDICIPNFNLPSNQSLYRYWILSVFREKNFKCGNNLNPHSLNSSI